MGRARRRSSRTPASSAATVSATTTRSARATKPACTGRTWVAIRERAGSCRRARASTGRSPASRCCNTRRTEPIDLGLPLGGHEVADITFSREGGAIADFMHREALARVVLLGAVEVETRLLVELARALVLLEHPEDHA